MALYRLHKTLAYLLIAIAMLSQQRFRSYSSYSIFAAALQHPPENEEDIPFISKEFLQACQTNDQETVESILSDHPDWIFGLERESGEMCLHEAVVNQHPDLVEYLLLHQGADPNQRNPRLLRMHSLAWNAYHGHLETAQVLLRYGAKINQEFDAPAKLFWHQHDIEEEEGNGVIVTVLDVVNRMLESHHEDQEKSLVQQYRTLRKLLRSEGALTVRELRGYGDEDEL